MNSYRKGKCRVWGTALNRSTISGHFQTISVSNKIFGKNHEDDSFEFLKSTYIHSFIPILVIINMHPLKLYFLEISWKFIRYKQSSKSIVKFQSNKISFHFQRGYTYLRKTYTIIYIYIAYLKDVRIVSKYTAWLVYSFIFKWTFIPIILKTKEFRFMLLLHKMKKNMW